MGYQLTGTGIWSSALRYGDTGEAADAASEMESLGYTALWIPDVGGDLFGPLGNLLGATTTATIATGILNLWMHEPSDAAANYHQLTTDHGDRLIIGIGVSHGMLINLQEEGRYRRPLERMSQYLDGIDAASTPIPPDRRVLAALGPKMLELARDRAGGTHPYLVTPEHTAVARAAVGADRLVLPEQGVVLETDPDTARTIARSALSVYLGLPNYANNWKRFGFTDDDIADGGSDRLVDALVVWGDEDTIARRVQEHHDAGADHVCVQVLTSDPMGFALDEFRRLAPALTT